MLFNCCGHSLFGGVLPTWYHRILFVMTYHYEKMWFLMCLCRWLVVKAQNYPDIWQHTSYVYWYLFAFVPPLCSFSLSAVPQRTSKGKRKNGFEKTLWFGIKLWKDLDGHQGLSLPSLSLFSLSLCQRAGTVLPVLFDTQKSDTLLTCLHERSIVEQKVDLSFSTSEVSA